jgi:hypothetical protein
MHSWTRLCEILRLSCHRPTVRETSIHVCLLSDVQAWFCERVDTILLDQEDYTFTNEFCTAMGNVYPSEEERTEDINHRLSEYFGEPMSGISGMTGSWRNDVGVMVTCGSSPVNAVAILHAKYKNELCETGAPDLQNIAHFMRIVEEAHFARARTVCPALLLTIAGPHVGIAAAAPARGPCVDPVFPLLPLLVLKQDKRMMTRWPAR